MMLRSLLKEAEKELKEEEKTMAKEAIKLRLREIKSAEKILRSMKGSLEKLLDEDVDDISCDIEQ